MRSFIWLALTLASIASGLGVSKSARCGPNFGLTCKGSKFGDCCSQYSCRSGNLSGRITYLYSLDCGSTDAYCNIVSGCQAGWGICTGNRISSSRMIVHSHHLGLSSSAKISSTSTRRIYSTLQTSSRTASASTPSSTKRVTTNARCGKDGNGQTCLGSRWGNCCSQYSYVRC